MVANAGWGLDGKLVERKIPKKCALPPKKFTNARVAYLRYGTRTRPAMSNGHLAFP